MLDALVLSHSVADAANAPSPTLICSWTDGGLDAAWVHVASELEFIDSCGAHALVGHAVRARKAGRRLVLLRGRAIVDRMLTLTGCSGDLEIGDVDQVESAVAALARLGDEEHVL